MMSSEPIAIIGTGCRFAGGASSPSRLWELLQKPRDVASEPPPTRFQIDGLYHPDGSNPNTTNVRESYFLPEDVMAFDTGFFNTAANEALCLDPQQRVLLEVVYESLEAAGLRLEALQGSNTGVFCGAMNVDWESIVGAEAAPPQYAAVGMARNNLANRISYFFDWRGPSFVVDTACSSSLVALHQAVTALRQGECTVAAAVGVNLLLTPAAYILASNMHMLSPTGRSRMWDAQADGYARGEGVASVLVKRLSDAIADQDHIECVVRETGVNQDGRSMGLTMPSSEAQLQLARSTYARAGLDPETRMEDRPQYFEAHGTGTQAGDPQEARSIYDAFFGEDVDEAAKEDVLHVGSIKTVVGHTEGAAGLAGVIKTSLSIQHSTIPPNMHLNRLNPKLEPFASRLQVPVQAVPWRQLPPGVPRRASVNSFGFGGTNAHAILESYDSNGTPSSQIHKKEIPALLPFPFSASSERSLGALLKAYVEYLQANPSVDPVDLALSLLHTRSTLMYRVVFFASDIDGLRGKIEDELARRAANSPSTIVSRSRPRPYRILGIFTGQGAQWPQMGLELLSACPAAATWFRELQRSLDTLPGDYQPGFSLTEELSADRSVSRVGQAEISQPLCTAVQIVLVKFLLTLGVSFEAVVGHSSGEIAAAYAAGILTSHDAIRLSYLRGVVAVHAGGNDQAGAMLAAGLSMDEGVAFCQQEKWSNRINVAACNSPSSVTLSGDADAIQSAYEELQQQGKFSRLLRVDTAYHSHHMRPCCDPYLRALEACNIQLQPPSSTAWFSSVFGGERMCVEKHAHALRGKYWCDNMSNPVLFSQALTAALGFTDPSPDLMVEVGPHPALKGPVQQTISDSRPDASNIPYIGLLHRGMNGVKSLCKAIGSFWAYLGPDAFKAADYVRLYDPERRFSRIQELPLYPFDHSRSYPWQTRKWKTYRDRRATPNALLGLLSDDSTEGEWRWGQSLSRKQVQWLDGHQIQSQTVFPATGYVAMAMEAVIFLANERAMRLVQVQDLSIDQALLLSEDGEGVETVFRLHKTRSDEEKMTTARFHCHADIGGQLKTCASGKLTIIWGEPDATTLLPPRPTATPGLAPVDVEEFYRSLQSLGYGYTPPFRGITSLKYKLGVSRGFMANVPRSKEPTSALALHPGVMDTGLQAILATIGTPGDGQLSTLHIPRRIDSVSINPAYCGSVRAAEAGDSLGFDAALTHLGPDGAAGDVEVFASSGHGLFQIEGVQVAPLIPPAAADDRQMFSEVAWGPLCPDVNAHTEPDSLDWLSRLRPLEHFAFLAIRDVISQITASDRENMGWHQSRVVTWIDSVIDQARAGKHPTCSPEWVEESIPEKLAHLSHELQPLMLEILQLIQKTMPLFLRGEVTMLEVLRKDDLLGRFYSGLEELVYMNARVGEVVQQITYRYPRMKILEVGAGTASATKAVLNRIGQSYHSFTFTDISAGFFEDAQATLADHGDQMIFKALNIEQDPVEQGFPEHSYDLVIAANVLHATARLQSTMENVRRLLKPGGYLVALEVTNPHSVRDTVLMGGFEGWWLGEQDGRTMGPRLSIPGWEKLLRDTGFGGIDTLTSTHQDAFCASSVFVSQAVDSQIQLIREPLPVTPEIPTSPSTSPIDKQGSLLLVGGATEATSGLVSTLNGILAPYFEHTSCVPTLDSPLIHEPSLMATIVVADIDAPCFKDFTEPRLNTLKRICRASRNLLWVTAGPEAENPYLRMSRGILNSFSFELPQSTYQYLNVADANAVDPSMLATCMMRLVYTHVDNDYSLATHAHTTEFELRFEDGIMKIPRISHVASLNRRYAALKRASHRSTSLQNSIVSVASSPRGHLELVEDDGLRSAQESDRNNPTQRMVRIRVEYSTLLAVTFGASGFLSLVIGRHTETNHRIIAASNVHSSVVSVPSSWCHEVPGDIPDSHGASLLSAAVAAQLARELVQQVKPQSAILLHEADGPLQTALWILAVAKGIRPYFSSSKPRYGTARGVLFLHERSSTRALAGLLPQKLSVAVNCDNASSSVGLFERIESSLPSDVVRLDRRGLFQRLPRRVWEDRDEQVADALRVSCAMAAQIVEPDKQVEIVDLERVPGGSVDGQGSQIVRWSSSQDVPIRVQPASARVQLSGSKTYLLVGMTGDLGQSVCQWMITRGARSVVLTSRKPQVDARWIREMSKFGACVTVMTMDVTDRTSILQVDAAIRQRLPPVAGVVNGAMVLRDQWFLDTSFESMQSQVTPKVRGSLLLEEVYGNRELDFFILFGSTSAVVGNPGQSPYVAASSFMSSLIQRRRRQNLVGSIIHPAQITGVGYLWRMGSALIQLLRSTMGTHIVSERDLHELFAEGILAGHPQSGRNPEVIAGLTMADPTDQPGLWLYRCPTTWPFLKYHMQLARADAPSGGALVPMKEQLAQVQTVRDAVETVVEGFSAKIRHRLRLSEDAAVTRHTRPSELGVDSLVAVDLQTWFFKELEAEVPVLQVIGGSSVGELAEYAVARLPKYLLAGEDKVHTTGKGRNHLVEMVQPLVIDLSMLP